MSKKSDIIDAVIARLSTLADISDSHGNFFKNPFREIAESELPCVKVAIMNSDARELDNQITYQHVAQLMVAYQSQGNDDDGLYEELYAAEEAIADFLINDANRPGVAGSLYQHTSQFVYRGWDMDFKIGAVGAGAIVLKFDLTYNTEHTQTFNDLEGFEITVKHTDAGDDTDPIIEDHSVDVETV